KEATIQIQVEALRKYAQDKGYQIVVEYLDDGYSGAKLDRPGLDKLRDGLGSGEFDVVLFHSPDRLTRRALYQSIMLEEIEKSGVKFEFLNHPVDDSPEGKMLLGMQGLFAEYEGTKIRERTRRGKLHRAREGAMVGGYAPYGYRSIRRTEDHRARLEIDEYQAVVVRRMYQWLIEDKKSLRGIAKLLTEEGVATARGARQWQPMAVYRMLTNPAYKGQYRYRHSEQEEVHIPVPRIVTDEMWTAAQTQLVENAKYSRRNNSRNKYLLRGLIKCPRCGGSYTGHTQPGYRSNRCINHDHAISSTGIRCRPGSVSGPMVEEAVWAAVSEALRQPEVLAEEYRRRLDASGSADDLEFEKKIAIALKRIKVRENRVTDAYINEVMDLERYKAEMDKLTTERATIQRIEQDVDRRAREQEHSRSALDQIKTFCGQVSQGLDNLTFEEKQQLLRLVVVRITVDSGKVTIETIIPTGRDEVILRNRRQDRPGQEGGIN
ncbi:MAG: recombinase family protein, partial [Chloroflexi bacterium]|nr:recombinase family protein [Chloroflexota bacterium]